MATSKPTAKGEWLARHLPRIDPAQCRFTSRATWDYNCVGFVVGDYRWWQPDELDEFYWPAGVPRDYWVSTYVIALRTEGFVESTSGQFEKDFETIALFHRDHVFTHVVLVMPGNIWAAKLGELEDLEHEATADETLGDYGSLYAYLRRPSGKDRTSLLEQYKL